LKFAGQEILPESDHSQLLIVVSAGIEDLKNQAPFTSSKQNEDRENEICEINVPFCFAPADVGSNGVCCEYSWQQRGYLMRTHCHCGTILFMGRWRPGKYSSYSR
jgi:hypothetical protein